MARRRWYRGRAVFPSDQQGRHGGCLAAYLPVGRLTRPAPVLMARCFRGIRCDSASLPLRPGKGATIFKMMDVSRHKSVDTLRGYVRDAELFKDHAGAGLL